MTEEDFSRVAAERFGGDPMEWKFVCPVCGFVQSVRDYKNAGAPESAVAFSCVGRWIEGSSEAFSGNKGPCNYAGGGLIRLNPVKIEGRTNNYFALAQ
jgi:hypothetical protein